MQAARGTSLNDAESSATPPIPSSRVPLAIFATVASLLLAVDVVTKSIAVSELSDRGRVPVLGDVLAFNLAFNPGAAFNAGTEYTVVISLIAISAAIAVCWFARNLGSKIWAVALGSLLAGICGNLGDRLFREPGPLRGEVVDFLQLPNWPIFNVADICINVGAGLILLQAFRGVELNGTREVSDGGSRGSVDAAGDVEE